DSVKLDSRQMAITMTAATHAPSEPDRPTDFTFMLPKPPAGSCDQGPEPGAPAKGQIDGRRQQRPDSSEHGELGGVLDDQAERFFEDLARHAQDPLDERPPRSGEDR